MTVFSLAVTGGAYSLVLVYELSIAMASFVAEHGRGSRASVVVTRGLSTCNLRALVHRIDSRGE